MPGLYGEHRFGFRRKLRNISRTCSSSEVHRRQRGSNEVIRGKIPPFHFYRGQRIIPRFLDEVLSGVYAATKNKFTAIRLPVLNAWFFMIDTDTIRRFEGQRGNQHRLHSRRRHSNRSLDRIVRNRNLRLGN